jgi:asparagine synthase (glutamine-hydrolysing)
MCGIAGVVDLKGGRIQDLERDLSVMNALQVHRGPDDGGTWTNADGSVGFGHRRLTIIDLSASGHQPMTGPNDTVVTYNGEIYNYVELRDELRRDWQFRTRSDTETILAAYARHGINCVQKLRGMFAFALWDARERRLLCVRDRFGIKPFYYTQIGDRLYFASEMKALMPFLPAIETDRDGLAEYLTFQYTINDQTLFAGIKQLAPGHMLIVENGRLSVRRYWDVHYDIDHDHSPAYFERHLRELMDDSIRVHLRSDVPIGSYLSGGIDSSLIAILASRADEKNHEAFHGKFTCFPGYDESNYARAAAESSGKSLNEIDISAADFRDNVSRIIYHLDQPVAGPGSFPQYMTSGLAASKVKVVLGGQGGDEIFGGYARYVLAYFEQCIKAAIDGTYKNGNFVVTAESIMPNLGVLREYKPLIQTFWKEGLFESLDKRYFRLVDRSVDLNDEVDWSALDRGRVFETFSSVFNSTRNVRHEAYFDSMTHFDFKCLLPALLQVEDRMSMAHGLESRVPFLDHPLIEFVASVPADVKFQGGHMKHLIKRAYGDVIPDAILNRRDKMGFPVPLKEWMGGELKEFIVDTFSSERAQSRPYTNARAIQGQLDSVGRFSRKLWGLLSLELWYQNFHDRAQFYRDLLHDPDPARQIAWQAGKTSPLA